MEITESYFNGFLKACFSCFSIPFMKLEDKVLGNCLNSIH